MNQCHLVKLYSNDAYLPDLLTLRYMWWYVVDLDSVPWTFPTSCPFNRIFGHSKKAVTLQGCQTNVLFLAWIILMPVSELQWNLITVPSFKISFRPDWTDILPDYCYNVNWIFCFLLAEKCVGILNSHCIINFVNEF